MKRALTSKVFGERVYRKLSALVKNDSFDGVKAMFDATQKSVTAVDASCKLYMFGSTVAFGFHEKGSDVDFVALREQDLVEHIDANSELLRAVQSEFLGRLSESIRRENPTWAIDLVRRVRVPVLRVKGGSLIDFDITAHRRNGVRNSMLLRSYMEQLPLARWLCMIVKRWSKEVGLNASGEGGCVTSYGFNIMVVYYLLRSGLVKFVPPESISFSTIEPFPTELPLEPLTDAAVEELGELAINFLLFFIEQFKPKNEVITLSQGSDVVLRSSMDWLSSGSFEMGGKVHFNLCIEDPYEVQLNVGRHVTPLKLTLLRKHMERAVDSAFLSNP